MTDKTFTLYWRTGQREVVVGPSIEEACTLGGGSIGALDFYQHGDVNTHVWDSSTARWNHRNNNSWKRGKL